MSIEFTTTINNERYAVALPDANVIPVPSVATAAVEAQEASARLTQARREHVAAVKAIDTARRLVATQAAELAKKKKDLPKDIRRAVKDAEEAAADAELAAGAAGEAFLHVYYKLIAEVNANRTALASAALESANSSVQRMAAAREAFRSATTEAYSGFGLLGMFSENDRKGYPVLKYRDPKGSMRGFYVSQALEEMSKAVGHSNLELKAYERGESPTKREVEEADDVED